MSDLYSIPIERHSLSSFLLYSNLFFDFENFIKEKTFKNPIHQTIYNCIKNAYLNNEQLDKVILAQKLKNFNINFFEENLDIFAYIETLYESNINEKGGRESIIELITLKGCRDLYDMAKSIRDVVKNRGDKIFSDIVKDVDESFSKTLNSFTSVNNEVRQVYETLEENIEEIGNNPPKESDMLMGPFDTINRIYGSLLRPSAINMVGARSGIGKTSLGMFYNTWVAEKYDIPIIHLDNGEMSLEELQIRACSMFTEGQVPQWAIESGEWRKNDKWTKMMRDVWPRAKKIRMYYYDVSDFSPEETLSFVKRLYYKEIGRGQKAIVHYDYLKSFDEGVGGNNPEWLLMGRWIKKIKSFMKNQIPDLRWWMSIQLNKSAVNTGRTSNEVDDSENAIGLSDRIYQQTTHTWIIRPKLIDEIAQQGNQFGNLVIKNVKARFLGKDKDDHLNYVQMPDRSCRRNYINLQNNSFYFQDKGDLRAIVNSGVLTQQFNIQGQGNSNDHSGVSLD